MNVSVKLFATVREAAGDAEHAIEVTDEATVGDAFERFLEDNPAVADVVLTDGEFNDHIRAVHEGATIEEPLASDHPLSDGDELALFPPLSGG